MRTIASIWLLAFLGVALSEDRHVVFDEPEAEGSSWEWIPVTLSVAERKLLDKRSALPKTALDFYLLLPGTYFEHMANETERRIAFIDQSTLSDQYLHAEYTVPSTDAGAFWVTIRLFEIEDETIIAIRFRSGRKRLYTAKGTESQKLWSITLGFPEFWRYEDGALLRMSDHLMPELAVTDILDRYRNHYQAHLNRPSQQKSIWLDYVLPAQGNRVKVTGRENFMRPGKEYVWAEYRFDKDRFVPSNQGKMESRPSPD